MSLASCRSAIAQVLTAKLPGVHVTEHGGPFTLKELDRVSKRLPAAVVVCLGAKGEDQASVITAMGTWAVFVVTKNEAGDDNKRDVAALLIAEAVMAVAMRERWNQQASGKAMRVDINNLFSTEIDKRGVALLATRWQQQVDLVGPDVVATLDQFETFFGTYDIGVTDDTPVTEQQVELEQ